MQNSPLSVCEFPGESCVQPTRVAACVHALGLGETLGQLASPFAM